MSTLGNIINLPGLKNSQRAQEVLEGTGQTWSNCQASNSDIKVLLVEEYKLVKANEVLAKLKKSDIMTRVSTKFFP